MADLDRNPLLSHYPDAEKSVQNSWVPIAGRKVIDIQPVSNMCEKEFPCGGHGDGCIITFEDGTTLTYQCSSVDHGALEVFHLPERFKPEYSGSKHFISYISEEFAKKLWGMRGG